MLQSFAPIVKTFLGEIEHFKFSVGDLVWQKQTLWVKNGVDGSFMIGLKHWAMSSKKSLQLILEGKNDIKVEFYEEMSRTGFCIVILLDSRVTVCLNLKQGTTQNQKQAWGNKIDSSIHYTHIHMQSIKW